MKVVKWCGFIIAGLIVVYALLLVISGAKLRSARERLAANGRPTSAEQIIPGKIADKDNAALIYESAALTLKSGGDLWKKIEVKQLSGTNRDEVVKYMESEEVVAALDLIRKGTGRAGCRYDLDYTRGAEMLLSHDAYFRAIARLLAVQTKLMAEKGDSDGAWKNVIAGYKLADAPRSEPMLISQLVRIAMFGIVDQSAVDLCKTSKPNDAQCEAIANAVKLFVDVSPIVRSMDGERLLLSDWVFAQMESYPGKTLGLISMDSSESAVNRFVARIIFCKPFRQFMHASCIDTMSDLTKFMETPFWSAPLKEARRIEQNIPRWNIISRMLVPALSNTKARHASAVAKAELTGTVMSLIRHKLAHGSFPVSLAECDAKFLPVQPVDPFSGQAPIYRLEGNGFVLYSIGENMKDDGAKPEPNSEERAKLPPEVLDSKAWDLVWRFEGK